MVLSGGTPHGDELATQGQATPLKAATFVGSASLSNRGGEQHRASAAGRNRRAAIPSHSPVAENRYGARAAVLGRTEVSGDGRRARHFGEQRWREAQPSQTSS